MHACRSTLEDPTEAVTYTATDTTDTITIIDTAVVAFTPGAASASTSTVNASPTSVVADGTSGSTVTVTLKDGNGNPVAGKTISLGQGAGHSTVTPATASTNALGVATFTVKNTTAETVTYTATDTTDTVTITDTAAVAFTAGAVSAATSTVNANPTTVTADGAALTTITVTLKDAHSNGVPGKTVAVAQGPGHSVIAPASAGSDVTNATGVATFTAGDVVAESVTYSATDTTDAVAVTDTASVTYTAGGVSGVLSTVTPAPTTIIANGVAASLVTVTLRDAQSNPVAGKTVALSQGAGHSTIAPAAAGSEVTSALGVATFTVKSATAELVTYSATDTTDSIPVTPTATVTYLPGGVSGATSTLTATPSSVTADGVTSSLLTVTLKDSNGNLVPGKTVSLAQGSGHSTLAPAAAGSDVTNNAGVASFRATNTTAEPVTYTASDATDSVTVAPKPTVTYVPGPAANVALSLTPTTMLADGTSQSNAVATITDAHGNPVLTEVPAFTSTGDAALSAVSNAGAGAYKVLVTASKAVGVQTITVTTSNGKTAAADLTQLTGAPAVVTVTLSTDTLTSDGLSNATAIARVLDAVGHPLAAENVTFSTSGDALLGAITNNGDGTYSAPLTSSFTTDAETITATASNGVFGAAVLTEVAPSTGYWLAGADGKVYSHGLASLGQLAQRPVHPIVAMAVTPDNKGYWLVGSDGGIFAFGTARFFGSTGGITLNKPIVGIAAAPDGQGYYLVGADGAVFAFGSAQQHYFGSAGAFPLNKPIVGMALYPNRNGYWLVASDGGIFSFHSEDDSDRFFGSTGSIRLNQPIVGMTPAPDGRGYWMVASDGGVFAFGSAAFYGSTGSITLNRPIVAMSSTGSGLGYWFVASDGGIFSFGDAPFLGSEGGSPIAGSIVGMTGFGHR